MAVDVEAVVKAIETNVISSTVIPTDVDFVV